MRGPKLYLNADDRATLLELRGGKRRNAVKIERDTFKRLVLEFCGFVNSESDTSHLDSDDFHELLVELNKASAKPVRLTRGLFDRLIQDHERMRARVTPR